LPAGPGAANFSLYKVSYVQPVDGIERVPNGDFSAGAESWSLQGQTQIVPSDRGPGQMVQVVAAPSQLALLDSYSFGVTGGAAFQLSFSAASLSKGIGYFWVGFLDATGNSIEVPQASKYASYAEWIPMAPAKLTLGTTSTDTSGNYKLSLTSLGTSQVTLEANYPGYAQHWPGYAQVP
jgi:hypothetical protein